MDNRYELENFEIVVEPVPTSYFESDTVHLVAAKGYKWGHNWEITRCGKLFDASTGVRAETVMPWLAPCPVCMKNMELAEVISEFEQQKELAAMDAVTKSGENLITSLINWVANMQKEQKSDEAENKKKIRLLKK